MNEDKQRNSLIAEQGKTIAEQNIIIEELKRQNRELHEQRDKEQIDKSIILTKGNQFLSQIYDNKKNETNDIDSPISKDIVEENYKDLITKIENINEIVNKVSCTTDGGIAFLQKKLDGAKPVINKGLDLAIKEIQNNIPESWRDDSQEFIDASNIIYERLNIRLKFLPSSELPVSPPGIDSDLNFKKRPIVLKKIPNAGALVIELPQCEKNK